MAWYGDAFDDPPQAGGLTLRVAAEADAPAVLALLPETVNGRRTTPQERRRIADQMISRGFVLVARDPDGHVVGSCVLARRPDGPLEIGWAVASGSRGRGHATAMAGAVIARLLEGAVDEVRCTIETGNAASLRIAEKLGFEPADPWLAGTLSFRRQTAVPFPVP
jgi:RimJ/RimL family protein N-acetyltransferase